MCVCVCLSLDRLTVLIGENGTGKSTILEAIELLRRATYPAFLSELNVIHGGLFGLGAPNGFDLWAVVEKEPIAWRYNLRVGAKGTAAVIEHETHSVRGENSCHNPRGNEKTKYRSSTPPSSGKRL